MIKLIWFPIGVPVTNSVLRLATHILSTKIRKHVVHLCQIIPRAEGYSLSFFSLRPSRFGKEGGVKLRKFYLLTLRRAIQVVPFNPW